MGQRNMSRAVTFLQLVRRSQCCHLAKRSFRKKTSKETEPTANARTVLCCRAVYFLCNCGVYLAHSLSTNLEQTAFAQPTGVAPPIQPVNFLEAAFTGYKMQGT